MIRAMSEKVNVHVLVQLEVVDFERFLENFNTRGLRLRRRHGSRDSLVFRHRGDPSRVSLLLEWTSEEAFQGFLDDPDVRESMRLGGTVGEPELTLLDAVEELPH
jgi:heme-degrading monooxygenase HmoA